MAKTFEIDGLNAQVKRLRAIMTNDPSFRKKVNNVIRKVLNQARKDVMAHAKGELDSDPRHAYKAVRSAVYKRILGGQVNILNGRKAGRPTGYRKPLKGLPKRGGNRWGRSQRTIELEGYEGKDRGFILRFINAGAQDRAIRSYTDHSGTHHSLRTGGVQNIKTRGLGGNRGSIAPRNWFGSASQKALEGMASNLQNYIDNCILEEFA